MRKYLVAFLLLTIPVTHRLYAQNDELELLRNKFAINLFSYVRRPVVQGQEAFYPVVFHGLLYTREVGTAFFVRAHFDYFQRNRDHSTDTNMDVNLYSDILMGGGGGYLFGKGDVHPYVGADLVMTSVLQYSENGGVDADNYRKIQSRSLGVSLMPFAGVSFQVTRVLSFALETNVELGYIHRNGTDFTWGEDHIPEEKVINSNDFFTRWNPLSVLSVALSF